MAAAVSFELTLKEFALLRMRTECYKLFAAEERRGKMKQIIMTPEQALKEGGQLPFALIRTWDQV